jgi:hypothetical protein
MDGLDSIIKKVYKIRLMIVVCGDLNINPLNADLNPICNLLALLGAHHILHLSGIRVNYHAENGMRKQDDAVLILYDLTSGVDFSARIRNKSSRAINNILINTLHFSSFLITPLVHGLSDPDNQLLTINESCVIKSLKEIMSPFMICNIYF